MFSFNKRTKVFIVKRPFIKTMSKEYDLSKSYWKPLLIAILPSSYFWILATFFFLIYSFDMLWYVKEFQIFSSDNSILSELIVLSVVAVPTALGIGLTGNYIDRRPENLGKLILSGLLGSSIMLLADTVSMGIKNGILILFAVGSMGLFLGIEITSAFVLFSVLTQWNCRGRVYALSNLLFAIFTFLLIFVSEITELRFFLAFPIISIFGILISLFLFFPITRMKFWQNDKWPTKDIQIFKRYSVQAYSLAHISIYLMLGLTIGSLAQAGFTIFMDITMESHATFWIIVILGTIISILPAGALADRWGRKTLTILAVYGILGASLLVGFIELNFTTFTLASLLIGIAFAFLHPTLDSSLWIDLASKDSIGRYLGINGLTLGAGLAAGFLISYFLFLDIISSILNYMVFFYIGLAVLTLFPLFWTSDSYPPLEFFLLLVINEAGVPIFHYQFGHKKELRVDLPLISGALSAVGTFMVEATGEEEGRLNLVNHGSHFILTDESKRKTNITAAIFSNKNDHELQVSLRKFLLKFHEKYETELVEWKGNLDAFKDAYVEAEQIFGPLITLSRDEQLVTNI